MNMSTMRRLIYDYWINGHHKHIDVNSRGIGLNPLTHEHGVRDHHQFCLFV